MKAKRDPQDLQPETTAVLFTLSELQLLQSTLRHEVQNASQWRYPPCSLEVNDQVAAALLFCFEFAQNEAPLALSYADCLAIDAVVPQTAKDINGTPVGYHVLLKSYAARRALRAAIPMPTIYPANELSLAEIRARLAAFHQQSSQNSSQKSAQEEGS